jgi:hypothetical protein
MRARTSTSKFAPARAATRRAFSCATCFACTPVFLTAKAFVTKFKNSPKPASAASKRRLCWCWVSAPTTLVHLEAGTHRVQRIPATEANGRIHTSAVTVAVIPEADEDEIKIDPGDLRIDVFRSSGSGGQHVNKTESAVRITHLPTGIVCRLPRREITD